MTTPTFTWPPSYGAQQDKQPKVYLANYGDGYTQRLASGINNNPSKWSLTFTSLDDITTLAITNFLDALAGASSFNWTDPTGFTGLYYCPTYSRSYDDEAKNTVKATFQQVFGG